MVCPEIWDFQGEKSAKGEKTGYNSDRDLLSMGLPMTAGVKPLHAWNTSRIHRNKLPNLDNVHYRKCKR